MPFIVISGSSEMGVKGINLLRALSAENEMRGVSVCN